MVAFFLVRSTVNVGDNMSYSGPRVSLSDNVPDSTMFWSFGMKFVLTGSESKGTFTRSRFEQFIHNSGKHGIRLAGNMSPWSRKDSVSDFVRLDTPEYYPTEHAYISITFRSQKGRPSSVSRDLSLTIFRPCRLQVRTLTSAFSPRGPRREL